VFLLVNKKATFRQLYELLVESEPQVGCFKPGGNSYFYGTYKTTQNVKYRQEMALPAEWEGMSMNNP